MKGNIWKISIWKIFYLSKQQKIVAEFMNGEQLVGLLKIKIEYKNIVGEKIYNKKSIFENCHF